MAAARPLQPDDPAWLGAYELRGRLGEGGQSVVYLGRGADGREVAVKLLRAQLSRSPEWRARFAQEIKVIGRVAGFCTAQVIDADVDGDLPYVVSEYVPGPSLTELVTSRGPRVGTDLDRLAIGTITALAAIHRAGILHRDFKPSNVLMGPDGPRVIDFGIARVMGASSARSSGVVGTPSYMAPEAVNDAPLGSGVDLFAWGATMLFAATGRHPFGNDNISAVFHRILHQDPDLSPLPDSLREIVGVCLAKDPARRPEAQQVLLDLLGRQAIVDAGPRSALTTGASFAGDDRPAEPATGPTVPPVPVASAMPGPVASPVDSAGGPASPGPAVSSPPGVPQQAHPLAGTESSGPQSHPTIPPAPRRRGRWRVAAIVAAPLLALGVGGAVWALQPGGDDGGPRVAADTAAPPAESNAAAAAAGESVKAVLSFDYRTLDRDIAGAHARVTARYRAEYDRQLRTGNWQARLSETKGSVTTEVADTAVVASSQGTVTLLSYVKRTVRSENARPNVLREPMRTTMVRQGDGWLLDTLYVLKADSVPLATGGAGWPGSQARAVLDAVSRDRTVAAGSLVESALRSGGAAGQIDALAVVAECSPGSCTANDKVGVHRLRLRQVGGGWQVAGAERL